MARGEGRGQGHQARAGTVSPLDSEGTGLDRVAVVVQDAPPITVEVGDDQDQDLAVTVEDDQDLRAGIVPIEIVMTHPSVDDAKTLHAFFLSGKNKSRAM